MLKLLVSECSFWVLTLFAIFLFAFYEIITGLAECIFEIAKKKVKMEDFLNETREENK